MDIVKNIKGPNDADYWARCYVQGTKRHSKTGAIIPVCQGWSDRFLPHPLVRQATTEGWADELRAHFIGMLKRWLMARAGAGDSNAAWPAIETIMPDKKWIEGVSANAARYRLADAAREANPPKPDVEPFVRLPSVVQSDFQNFQREAARTADGRARHEKPIVGRR